MGESANLDTLQHGFLAASRAWLGDKIAAAAHVGRRRELDGTLELERVFGDDAPRA